MSDRPIDEHVYTDADIAGILHDLNGAVTDHDSLLAWSQRSGVRVERSVDSRNLIYFTLARRDQRHRKVGLMLLEGTWEHAT